MAHTVEEKVTILRRLRVQCIRNAVYVKARLRAMWVIDC